MIGRERAEDRQRGARAHALHRQQQPEPGTLGLLDEAVEMDVVLAHMGLDQELERLAVAGDARQGALGAEDEIAHPVDVQHQAVGARLIDDAGQESDHRATLSKARLDAAWWAWQMAHARASAASDESAAAPGSSRCTMASTWRFSA